MLHTANQDHYIMCNLFMFIKTNNKPPGVYNERPSNDLTPYKKNVYVGSCSNHNSPMQYINWDSQMGMSGTGSPAINTVAIYDIAPLTMTRRYI